VKVLLDTNILLRLAVVSHPTHAEVVSAVHKIRQRGDQPAIVPQVLYEYLGSRYPANCAKWPWPLQRVSTAEQSNWIGTSLSWQRVSTAEPCDWIARGVNPW
jgi:predicted nucleic acid-binding protein